MSSYKFSLEKVLEWRIDNEKRVAKRFATIRTELEYQKTTLNNLRLEEESIKKKILQSATINELKHQHILKGLIQEKIQQQEDLIARTEAKLEEVRKELLEAQKGRKIMEKLKEKDYREYVEKLMYEEQKQLDEIAVLRSFDNGQAIPADN